MKSLPKLTVCGCGSGGMATAADLALLGCTVNLYEYEAFAANLIPIRENDGIALSGNTHSGKEGLAKLNLVTDDPGKAIQDSEIILINVPAPVVEVFVKSLAPHFQAGQVVVVTTGYWAALRSRQILREHGADRKVIFVEEHIMPYLSRKLGPAEARIYNYKRDIRISAWPASKNAVACEVMQRVYPQMRPSKNILENNFQPGNSSVHVQINLPRAEFFFDRAREFRFYAEASPCAARLADAFDEERRRVAAAFGSETPTYVEWFNAAYEYGGNDLYEIFGKITEHGKRWGNDAGNKRVLIEDLCYFFIPMEQLAQVVGEPVPATTACIEMTKVFTGYDYRANGITLQTLGMEGMTRDQIIRYVTEGLA